MNEPILNKQYLVSGPFLNGKTPEIKESSLELIRNQFFGIEGTGSKQTLIATDSFGVLRSVGSNSQPKPQHTQRLSSLPLNLSVVPDGAARATYFSEPESWQSKLIAQINKNKTQYITTIPLKFAKKHLVPLSENSSAEDKEIYNSIGDTDICGQLIRKIRGLVLIFSSKYLKTGIIQATLFDVTGRKIKEVKSTDIDSLEYISSLNRDKCTGSYKIFFVDDMYYEFPEGKYRIEIKSTNLQPAVKKWCDTNNLQFMSFSIEVKFGVKVLTGEFDFHQLDPLSLEEAILTQYSYRFSHVFKSVMKEPSKEPDANYTEYKTGLQTWIERTEWFNEKQKLITGFIGGDTNKRIKRIGTELIQTFKMENQENSKVEKDVKLLSEIWEGAFALLETKESWNDYLSQLKVSDSVKKISQIIDGNWITKNCHAIRWKKFLLSHVDDDDKSKLVIDLLDKGLTKEKTALLIKDGIPKQALEFDEAILRGAGKTLAALDTAMSVYQIASLISTRYNLENKFELHNNRFTTGTSTYLNKFGARANFQAITMLEVLRRTADSTKMDLDENAKEILAQSLDFILGIATFVPVIGEVAALISAVKITVESAANFAAAMGTVIDRRFLDEFFADLNSYFGQLAVLEEECSINMGAICALLKEGKKPNDPAIQFRLRAGILAGLLRLIDRCGTRYNNEVDFRKKVEQYDIKGYINKFITNPSPTLSITIQSDIPLDEIWLFCNGNKKGMGLLAAHRTFRTVKKNAWAIPAVVISPALTAVSKAIEIMTVKSVPLSYQRMFPIHLQSSIDTFQLSKIFSTNYSGFKESNLVYSNIYVYIDKKWIEVASCKEMITPLHQIRIVIVLESKNSKENLTGLPVSLQLVRTDSMPDIYGPIYKGQVQKLNKTGENGFDKGLLPEEELLFPGKICYGYVLHPFYFFDDALFKGTKPCGHIGFSGLPEIINKFILKIGDKAFDITSGASKKAEYKVKLPLISPLTNMIIRRDFTANKTSEIVYTPVFLPTSKVGELGYFVKNKAGWIFKSSVNDSLYHTKDFDFSWNKPFEIIFVLKTFAFHEAILKKDAIKFPVQITVLEDNMINLQGPSYPAEALGFNKGFYNGVTSVGDIESVLRSGNVFHADERVVNGQDKVKFTSEFRLVAIRLQFAYSVENKDGDMGTYQSLKPFGEKYHNDGTGYEYLFKIDAPGGIVMPSIQANSVFNFPGIAATVPEMSFLSSKMFVTGKTNLTSLEVQKCDFE